MGERNDARREIEASRARMSVIADELARRTSPDYVRDRAREAAMSKANQARERIASRPGILAAIGAAAGGSLGMMLGKKAKSRASHEHEEHEERWETREYRSEEAPPARTYTAEPAGGGYAPGGTVGGPVYSANPEVGSWSEPYRSPTAEQAWRSAGPSTGEEEHPSKRDQLRHKAQDLKGRMSEKAGEMKHRMSEKTGEMKHKVAEKRSRMQQRSEEQGSWKERVPSAGDVHRTAQKRPIGTILGGAALGMLAASLLPLTRRERKVMHPARERAREQLGEQFRSFEHKVEERLSGKSGERGEEARGERGGERRAQGEEPAGGGDAGAARTAGSNEPGGPARGGGEEETAATGGTYATSTGEPGGTEVDPNEPYRQPSFAEQLERAEDKSRFH